VGCRCYSNQVGAVLRLVLDLQREAEGTIHLNNLLRAKDHDQFLTNIGPTPTHVVFVELKGEAEVRTASRNWAVRLDGTVARGPRWI
jgi:hypothetical protein